MSALRLYGADGKMVGRLRGKGSVRMAGMLVAASFANKVVSDTFGVVLSDREARLPETDPSPDYYADRIRRNMDAKNDKHTERLAGFLDRGPDL